MSDSRNPIAPGHSRTPGHFEMLGTPSGVYCSCAKPNSSIIEMSGPLNVKDDWTSQCKDVFTTQCNS